MKNDVLSAAERLATADNEILAALAKNLERDVVRDAFLLNETATKIEFDLRSRRETDLDFLETDFHEQLKVLEFLFDAHGLGERLIAVAEIDAAPHRRARERAIGPLPVGQGDGRERAVFGDRRGLHGETGVEKRKVERTNDRKRADEPSNRKTAVRGLANRPTRDPPLGGALTIARVRKSKGLSKRGHCCG